MEVASEVGTELALSALSLVVKKLASYVGGDVTPAEMKHLSDFVRYKIVALTREASSDDLVQSMPLLEDLQAAALELEDLLDEYEYKQIEKQVSPSSSNPIKNIIPRTMLPKSSLRKKFEKLLEFVKQVEEIHPFIKSITGTTQPHAINAFIPKTSTPSSPFYGRADQCDMIIEFLVDESHANLNVRTKNVSIIAIRGLGGAGKTTTAQHVHNDNRIVNYFDLRMWVQVTRGLDEHRLIKEILESANVNDCSQMSSFDVLQKRLKVLVSEKKFLLVLDDVWEDDTTRLDTVLSPLNQVGVKGSKIIITTRTEKVAKDLHAKPIILLDELKDEDCWSILKHYAFYDDEKTKKDIELKYVGNQIIGKAERSPLALKVVGSSLSNKRSVNEWENILEQDVLKETRDLLLFSYQCLPSHLQRCFAYCSLFPKGYTFYFDFDHVWNPHLIYLWIAQGFIENTSELTLEEVGKKYIEELLSYSFFEKKYANGFVIHDLLHDLAEKVSKKQCHRIEHHESLHIPKTCIHLSLYITEMVMVNVVMSNIVDIFKLGNLRSLIILGDDSSTNIFKSIKDLFQNLTKLRTLYVTYKQTKVLSDPHIDKLKHLRYLHVKYGKKLPGYLTKLYHIQFLILSTDLADSDGYLPTNTLPQGLSNLINLRSLQFYEFSDDGWLYELDWLYYNSEMIKIEKLKSLQNLGVFYPDGFNGMTSLRNLSLCGSLYISLENVKCKEEAEEAMLNQKKNINELSFGWSSTSNDNSNICEEVLEGLVPHRNLEKLNISFYQGVRFPNWMVKENWLPCLQTLELFSCRSVKIVPFLPPCLQKLIVSDCHELMQLPPPSDTLRTLILTNCLKLMQLPPLSDTLRTLCLSRCLKLTPPSMFNKSPGLEILRLTVLPCLHTLTSLSPTLVELRIEYCPNLTGLGNLQSCTSLQTLQICECPMLMRKEPSIVEGVVQGDIANRFPQLRHIEADEPLLVLELFQQQAFSSIKSLVLRRLQRPFLHMSDEYFHHFSSLNRLSLNDCGALPNLEKLSSLNNLYISRCPDVESLPNLPVSLQYITIWGCPKLKEKYEEGGPLRNTISRIPEIDIR